MLEFGKHHFPSGNEIPEQARTIWCTRYEVNGGWGVNVDIWGWGHTSEQSQAVTAPLLGSAAPRSCMGCNGAHLTLPVRGSSQQYLAQSPASL